VKTEELEVSRLQISEQTTMGEILLAYPSAKIGLFQRYHVGGCSACGYESTDTLADVRRTHNLQDDLPRLVACIEESQGIESRLHVSPADVRAALAGGEKVHLLDARSAGEWDASHIDGAQPIGVELTFEILDSWPKDAAIVLYSNHGQRSLERASYFTAYGKTNVRSMDGGIEAWKDLGGRVVPAPGAALSTD